MEIDLKKGHYVISIGVVCGVALICYPFTNWIGYRSIALLLLLTVSVLAMRLSLYPVLIAAVLSALIWDFFFIPPHFTFTVGNGEDSLLLMMYFIVACLSGVFHSKLRQFAHLAHRKEERETALQLYNTLFNSLSHELRTPIATILGATDALAENGDKLSQKNQQELFTEISNAALRLHSQLENLLNTSRLDSGIIRPKLEWCDVNDLIYNSLDKAKKNNLTQHKVHIEIDSQLPLVKLDFGLMEQVLNNLFKNAVSYTPNHTQITISAYLSVQKTGQFDDATDKITHQVTSHQLIIKMADEGSGIPENDIPYLFDKFYRLENTKTGGTGLGLFIVKGFIEAQGGTINVLNPPKGGATFIIQIPTLVLNKNIHYEFS